MSVSKGHYFRKDIDNEVIKHEYIDLQMSTVDLGEKYYCSPTTIKLRLIGMGVVIRDIRLRSKIALSKVNKVKYKIDKEWLIDKYIIQKISISKIAKEIGCSDSVISKALELYSIPKRSQLEVNRLIDRSDWDFSYLQITKKRKNGGDLSEIKISKEELYQKYIVERRSAYDISNDYGCTHRTIKYKLQKFNIPLRDVKDAYKTGYWEGKIKNTGREEYIEHECVPENPHDGFEINGKLIGKIGTYVWLVCVQCGIGRWVSKSNSKRFKTNGLCYDCMQIDNLRCKKISEKSIERLKNPEERMKISKISKSVWAQDGYKDRQIRLMRKGSAVRPTKPEIEVLKLLEEITPDNWKYVGDGEVILGGKNPDIINCNGYKAIIEVNGTYWHSRQNTKECPLLHEIWRIDHYKKYGYYTLVVWEHELKHKEQVIKKIQSFYSEISKPHH